MVFTSTLLCPCQEKPFASWIFGGGFGRRERYETRAGAINPNALLTISSADIFSFCLYKNILSRENEPHREILQIGFDDIFTGLLQEVKGHPPGARNKRKR